MLVPYAVSAYVDLHSSKEIWA